MVQKKSVRISDKKEEGSSSMMIKEDGGSSEDEGSNAETELYNLMRGHTSLMMVGESSDSDSEQEHGGSGGEENSDSESDQEDSSSGGGESSDSESGREESSSGKEPEMAPPAVSLSSLSSSTYEWGAPLTRATAPSWGNNVQDQDPEIAKEWKSKSTMYYRRSRDQDMARGGSPPPKFEEENLFSEGNSRKRVKPFYRPKEDITDKVEDRGRDSVDQFIRGKFDAKMRKKKNKGLEGSHSPPSKLRKDCVQSSSSSKDDRKQGYKWKKQYGKGKEEETSSDEGDEDENSSEEDDEKEAPSSDRDKEYSDSERDSDDETISGIFGQIGNGNFDPKKKRKRFERNREGQQKRKVEISSAYLEEYEDVATRCGCAMSTKEALHRLTRNEKEEREEFF